MSRIGRLPVAIPAGVTVEIAENNKVTVKGPKGTLERELPTEMSIKLEGEEVVVTRPNDLKKMKSLHGLTRTLINNMVVGVTEGYQKVPCGLCCEIMREDGTMRRPHHRQSRLSGRRSLWSHCQWNRIPWL